MSNPKWDKALRELAGKASGLARNADSDRAGFDAALSVLRERLEPLLDAVSNFGARVQERCPSWFAEPAGSTDFAEARDWQERELSKWRS